MKKKSKIFPFLCIFQYLNLNNFAPQCPVFLKIGTHIIQRVLFNMTSILIRYLHPLKSYRPPRKKNLFPPPHKIFTTEIKIFSIFSMGALMAFIFSRFWPLPKMSVNQCYCYNNIVANSKKNPENLHFFRVNSHNYFLFATIFFSKKLPIPYPTIGKIW